MSTDATGAAADKIFFDYVGEDPDLAGIFGVPARNNPKDYSTMPVLGQGDTGAEVKDVQRMLKSAGYPVSVTGTYDFDTQTQVAEFQTDHGLQSDGVVAAKTWAALYGEKSGQAANLLSSALNLTSGLVGGYVQAKSASRAPAVVVAAPPPPGPNWLLIGGGVVGAFVLVGGAIFLLRRS